MLYRERHKSFSGNLNDADLVPASISCSWGEPLRWERSGREVVDLGSLRYHSDALAFRSSTSSLGFVGGGEEESSWSVFVVLRAWADDVRFRADRASSLLSFRLQSKSGPSADLSRPCSIKLRRG